MECIPLLAIFGIDQMFLNLEKPEVGDVLNVHAVEEIAFYQSSLNVISLLTFFHEVTAFVFKHEDLLAQIIILKSDHIHD